MEYKFLNTRVIKHDPKDVLKHKWEICTTPYKEYVKRDGVEWNEVIKISTEYDVNTRLTYLILECYANVDKFLQEPAVERLTDATLYVDYDLKTDTVCVFRNTKFLEELVGIDVWKDASVDGCFSKVRLKLLTQFEYKLDYGEISEEEKETI